MQHHQWKRSGIRNEHHLLNKSRGGLRTSTNLITLDTEHHLAWHFLFGNMDIDEVVALLLRIKNCNKKRRNKNEQKRLH